MIPTPDSPFALENDVNLDEHEPAYNPDEHTNAGGRPVEPAGRNAFDHAIRIVLIPVAVAVVLLLGGIFNRADAQALISDRIIDYGWPGHNAPGYRFNESRTPIANDYTFEIRFGLDPSRFSVSQRYSCGYPVPEGYWLYDRYPSSGSASAWAVAVGGNGTLCYWDAPGRIQFQGVQAGICYTLTARRQGGQLTVTLNGDTRTTSGGGGTYRSGANGIGIGREINGYSDWISYDSFPGEISYVEDNGRIVDFQADGSPTGGSYLGASMCGDLPPPPPPPPPPDPEPTACDIDPNSVECACETTPHPACNVCLAP